MKVQSNHKFNTTDKERWQKCADKQVRGNLTLWIEIQLNKVADKVLGKRKEDPIK